MVTEYPVRDAAGVLRAVHVRWDTPNGKCIAWRTPDGAAGLGGVPVAALPLYGSERVAGWAPDEWVVVTEGESDCDTLTAVGVPALGTVTGAASCPTPAALADVAPGRRFILWPDNDEAGRRHMTAVGAALYRAGAVMCRVLAYTPTVVSLPKGAGARDVIGGADPAMAMVMVAALIESWSLLIDRRTDPLPPSRPSRRDLVDTGSVSAALIAAYGVNARPGYSCRCPMHDDRHASLSVLGDDLRAKCHAGACPWSGRGVIADDVLAAVRP